MALCFFLAGIIIILLFLLFSNAVNVNVVVENVENFGVQLRGRQIDDSPYLVRCLYIPRAFGIQQRRIDLRDQLGSAIK